MPPKKVTWKAEPHTLAKIRIVEEYLKAWFPIISRHNRRVIYIDGFCGPGEYTNREKGSPIVALETAIFHQHDYLKNQEVIFVFNDADKSRIDHLESLIKTYDIPKKFLVECTNSPFEETLHEILNSLEGKDIAPTFLFIDPFGIKGIPFDIIQRFMENPKCEVMINFMAESINRFAITPEFRQYLDAAYGTSDWRQCLVKNDKDRCFISLYEARLKEIAKYVWSFEMKDNMNKRKYLLFFVTKNIKGLEKMKDAMWKIDPTGDFTFSDRYFSQLTIFNEAAAPALLKEIYLEKLHGDHSITEIECFTICQTPFRKAHVRKALKMLENEKRINVERPGAHSFPVGATIKF